MALCGLGLEVLCPLLIQWLLTGHLLYAVLGTEGHSGDQDSSPSWGPRAEGKAVKHVNK